MATLLRRRNCNEMPSVSLYFGTVGDSDVKCVNFPDLPLVSLARTRRVAIPPE